MVFVPSLKFSAAFKNLFRDIFGCLAWLHLSLERTAYFWLQRLTTQRSKRSVNVSVIWQMSGLPPSLCVAECCSSWSRVRFHAFRCFCRKWYSVLDHQEQLGRWLGRRGGCGVCYTIGRMSDFGTESSSVVTSFQPAWRCSVSQMHTAALRDRWHLYIKRCCSTSGAEWKDLK